ncbi:O-succinylbenzoic acid-CoA ligase MenE or related acyl-CoA synthetase (AMP-forming) [Cupriavidus necator]|uniref:Acyl-CoA synthetase n=1 Tax=Cupriavidus necator (strain ATCC 17699 / DSM 428 / KCTC 22496 / NCIMB 10442 / H16 / Stanier 337) TaxID=381666 RepID=Q0K0I0_CUPNH|nr:AMP-binding protein [Cupriavidus necator]QCC04325.1 acyl-CoA synthetase [Cupriavidus necator H16]QQB79014.1 AMP-binding protein [Cupriavidus necator]WKA43235.1 AMP-binding protein [Cupriavidus necator]CAJ96494.1 Acyl-CoA synthetase (AMP-forming)/AMP-acid ligase II [Cupriavidus necator H16]
MSRQASAAAVVHGGATVGQLYAAALRARPGVPAIVGDDTTLSYEALARQCARVARLFAARGLARQDAVAFLVGNRAEAVAAIIAAQLAGLKNVSLHPMASEADHAFVLQDAGVRALVVDNARFTERARVLAAGAGLQVLPLDDGEFGPGLANAAAAFDDTPVVPGDDPTEISRLAYTGGTTGRSKGILHTHRTTVTVLQYMLASYEWPAQIRYLVTTPISHASGSLFLPTLLRGGTIYVCDKFSPADFLRRVAEQRINLTFLVPTQIYGLLDCDGLDAADLSSLELVLYGAAPIAPVRLADALRRIGPVFGQVYGQAEVPMCISYLSQRDHDPDNPERLRSCGKVIPGNQVKLLDPDLREVAPGEVGELCVRGPLVMEGYLNRPEEDAKVFAGDWLHTGDMARCDSEGFLYIVDRAKDMIISGGFNVYPSEVEHCLALHPAIAMSAVIGIPDPKWGEAVTAVVVARPGAALTEADVIGHVTQHKGVVNAPKQVVFVDELPLTALGKIDRKAIRGRYWGGQERQVA